MLIINEREYVEWLLKTRDLGLTPAAALYRLEKYYAAQGLKKADVLKRTLEFVEVSRPLELERLGEAARSMLKRAMREPLIELGHIRITDSEMEFIAALDKLPLRKLAFTLLALAKYHTAVRPETNGWIRESDAQIFALAGVTGSRVHHGLMLNTMRRLGLIDFGRAVDSESIHVLFMTPGDEALAITDMRNLGYQYARYIGAGCYQPCTVCGILVPAKGQRPLSVRCKQHKETSTNVRARICASCGKAFVSSSRARTDLCPDCYEKHRRESVRKNVARCRVTDCL